MKPFNLYVREEHVIRAIAALTASSALGDLGIAKKWTEMLEDERRVQQKAAEAEASMAELRRSRAAEAVLTDRQAHMLGAARAGKSWSNTWTGSLRKREYVDGRLLGSWRHHTSMGGAINRMREALEDEGLLKPRRFELTPEGLERLERWERETGKSFPTKEDETAGFGSEPLKSEAQR